MNVEDMLRRLASPDGEEHVIIEFVAMAPETAVDLLLPYLGHLDSTLRAMAAKALGCLGRGTGNTLPQQDRVLACLEEMAETNDAFVVLHAAEAMLDLGGQRDLLASRLAWLLSAADVETRFDALERLKHMKEDAQAALPVLLKTIVPAEQLERTDAVEREVCWKSAVVVGEIGQASGDAAILQTWLASRDPMLRAVGACVLAKVSPDDAEMILPVLIEALSGDEEQRCYGALGCERLGPRAVSAIPLLSRIIQDGMEEAGRCSRSTAIRALGKIGSPTCVPVLMKVVRESESRTEDEFWTDCANACAILAEIGPAAMAAIHVLRRWVRRPIYDQMRLHAAVALWSINGNAEEALATARAWIGDEDRWIRCWAADLLGHLEPAARPMEADLQGLLNDEEEHVRRQAAKALAKIVPAE